MISLALLGRDISHSQSPNVYKRILEKSHTYTLLDFDHPEKIPSLDHILSDHDGLSITAPYKRHFLKEVQVEESILGLNAINCIRKNNDGEFEGTNTDYLAVEMILQNLIKKWGNLDVVLLGDGAMSFMTQVLLNKLGVECQLFSRRKNGDITNLKIKAPMKGKTLLVINSCARSFVFKGKIPEKTLFWDYNYDFLPHQEGLSTTCLAYFDGLEMLELQARFALKFWGISDF